MSISYKKRRTYKYILTQRCDFHLPLCIERDTHAQFISLTHDGHLSLAANYAWDGASGPMPDLPSVMRGALVHDALYQLMREGDLDAEKYRAAADRILLDYCLCDGMNFLLAQWLYFCVRRFGGKFARSEIQEMAFSTYTPPCISPEGNTDKGQINIPYKR